jgi:hypothetical protein
LAGVEQECVFQDIPAYPRDIPGILGAVFKQERMWEKCGKTMENCRGKMEQPRTPMETYKKTYGKQWEKYEKAWNT